MRVQQDSPLLGSPCCISPLKVFPILGSSPQEQQSSACGHTAPQLGQNPPSLPILLHEFSTGGEVEGEEEGNPLIC